MKLVMKGNKQLRISDDRLNDMLRAGYSEVDERTGKVLTPAAEPKLDALKKENAAIKAANKELAAQVEALAAHVKELEATGKK